MAKPPLSDTEVEFALRAIMDALFPQGEAGWIDWYRYAANGEWF